MECSSLRRAARMAFLFVMGCLAAGCGSAVAPSTERYVGNWEGAEDHLRIDRNGLGEGRVIRGRDARPFTWEQGTDRITITFDGSKRPEVFEARIDAQGHLVVSSPRTTVTLERVATPEVPPGGVDAAIAPSAPQGAFGTRAPPVDREG